ncbi:SecDF P1 head subdomain-containing protein [Actinomadura rifamycini]|uniref:SecDF P1 head subdomain-containing protein n=1 Tax=Actinomadura rifamycini TaxID=31962 RepID=UPI0012FBFA72|nr:hypothetical protein [Actinomadura rifamycini]
MNQYGAQPVPASPPEPGGGPPRKAVAIVAASVAVAVVLAAAGAFLAIRFAGTQHRGAGPAPRGPVELRMPLEFTQVADERQGRPCPSGYLPEGTADACLQLESGGFQVARVDAIEAARPEHSMTWGVELTLTGDDAEAFARLTERAAAARAGTPGQRIAVVVGGEIISAPVVMQPITGGEVLISGDFTRTQVDDLIERITGG